MHQRVRHRAEPAPFALALAVRAGNDQRAAFVLGDVEQRVGRFAARHLDLMVDAGRLAQRHALGQQLLTGLARPAWAQAHPEQAAHDACVADARCKELADRGQAEYQAQQYEAALSSLREAYALQPVPWLLFNVGRSLDTILRTADGLKFAVRECIYDSEMIPNSIIYPI